VNIEVPPSRKPSSKRSGTSGKPAVKKPQPPAREELAARGLVVQAPWRGHALSPELEPPQAAPARVQSPVLGAVDRSVPLEVFSVDIEIKANGQVLVVLRRPYDYPSGPLPGDPARFTPRVPRPGRF
jgi:hypothetical protein